MKQVSKAQFYGLIYKQKLDVHPSPQKHLTEWKRPTGQVWGVSKPGYLLDGPEEYYVNSQA